MKRGLVVFKEGVQSVSAEVVIVIETVNKEVLEKETGSEFTRVEVKGASERLSF